MMVSTDIQVDFIVLRGVEGLLRALVEGVLGAGAGAESDDDGIDLGNIVSGKRRRKTTTRLVDSSEWQHEYQQLILDDDPRTS